jgi:hypothetical protein
MFSAQASGSHLSMMVSNPLRPSIRRSKVAPGRDEDPDLPRFGALFTLGQIQCNDAVVVAESQRAAAG